MPLPKSAVAASRCSAEVGSPATRGTRRRNHAPAGPGSAKWPWVKRISIASVANMGRFAQAKASEGTAASGDDGPALARDFAAGLPEAPLELSATRPLSAARTRSARARTSSFPSPSAIEPSSNAILLPERVTSARTSIAARGTGRRNS